MSAAFLIASALASAQTNPTSLTEDDGVEDYPSFSPDGRFVVYAASEVGDVFGGNWDVWVIEIATGARRNLTESYDGDDRFPSFAPGGGEVAFWSDRDGGGYHRMAIDGGAPRKIETSMSFASGPGAWSNDGSEIALVTRDDAGVFLEIVDVASGAGRRRVPLSGKSTRRFDLSRSPDERYFAYVDGSSLTAHVTQIFVLDVASGVNVAVTDGWSNDWSPSWSAHGTGIYFVSNRDGKKDVWLQPLSDGRPRGDAVPITRDVGIRRAVVSPDGKRLVCLFPDWSPAGDWIAFYSERDGGGRIWAVTPDGKETKALTTGAGRFPRFSRDGSRVIFTGWAERIGNIFELDVASGSERPLTELSGRAGNLGSYVLATDDRYVYFTWEQNLGDLYLVDLP